MIGTTFGHYKIESKLGEGGMGVVYRAHDTELDRPVAIKTVLANAADDESLARFLREAKAASRLQHPAIMTIHQFGVQDNTRFIVMEYIEGRTVKSLLENGPLPVNEVCEIAIQVADGLALAHEKGVVHRDMKTENVMVTGRGQAKILDFGLAKLKAPEKDQDATVAETFKTEMGTVMGTVTHMSPEQALGAEVDGKSDIFSFGVVLYEMTTGKSPFLGPTAQATLARVLNHEPAAVMQLNAAIPAELSKLIQNCLRKDSKLRPSAKEVTAELKKISATLSVKDLVAGEIRAPYTTQVVRPVAAAGSTAAAAAAAVPAAAPVPSSGSTAAVKPGSARRISSTGSASKVAAPEQPSSTSRFARLYMPIKVLRVALSLWTLTLPLSFLFYMMVAAGVIRTQILEGTLLMEYVRAIVVPSLTLVESVFTFRPVVEGWNLMLAGLALLAFGVRQLILLPVAKAEHWAKSFLIRQQAGGAKIAAMTVQERESTDRLSRLRQYAEAQKELTQEKRRLAFLSVDVVGSTKMKIGEDKLVIEHAFTEYKKFVERILRTNNVWKVAWTPDGIMCAFFTTADAVRAGQTIIRELAYFNDGVHRLKTPFSVRCGVNSGEVIFPEDKSMEEISDEVIDVAGHMQKYAAPGSLWTSRESLGEAGDSSGFHEVPDQQVDDRVTFAWQPE